ncbi:2-oxoacid:ferredoxin oxidoreductase subunit beta [candidate division WOR-3 bacterium JGI_Cruoil_03_44_89]|uniref:2-oxoacid:ferredoxin oxidoreductase subunit beta n=1 Tax=candidate division WOR-3 bacterium JGI_Cruoil_03_44_89 TaxID=1973748 RepID=A0A235BXY1_UNCW3|nr:MAG: 2-oxoacid:ferredoxin oxidoreductase subunit beta [candidate division WOR-3 bacterium JGI_Cruoil_03_44_89]
MKTEVVIKYLRGEKLPTIWCPGCGDGIILASILRAVDSIGWKKDEVCMISGIGCCGRTPGYVDFHTLHTTHGRALSFATGMKFANPALKVIVVMGDGDAVAIGGNHFIHAARRNIDITAIIYNNYIYGMTGGQASPTTPCGRIASTAPYGSVEPPFDIVELAIGSGATYVARGTAYHVPALDKLIRKALLHRGFSVVDVTTPCPTAFGRRNRMKTPIENFSWLKENTISIGTAKDKTKKEIGKKIIIGEFLDIEKPEYTEVYEKEVTEKAKST